MTISDTQTFAVVKPRPAKPAHGVSVRARFREIAALEMAAIRAREDQQIQELKEWIEEVRADARKDLASWQRMLDHCEATIPEPGASKAGPAPYVQPAIEASSEANEDTLTGVVVEVAFADQPDLCEDPAATLARIEELHEGLESGAAS